MKNLLIFLLFLCSTITCFAQKDTTITDSKVVVFNKAYYIQTTSTHIKFEAINTNVLRKIDTYDDDSKRDSLQISQKKEQRKELVKLIKDAQKKGFTPKSDNSYDDEMNNRIINKINKEKQ